MSDRHELCARFEEAGLRLNDTLEAMLGEHPVHRTERRGCGFTQSTRHLAARINEPRMQDGFDDLGLFRAWRPLSETRRIARALEAGVVATWRNWDLDPPDSLALGATDDPALPIIRAEVERQSRLRRLPASLQREESRLIATLIRDIVLPPPTDRRLVRPPVWPEKLPVGSCPLAEKCFLELAHGFIPRKGICNLLVDHNGAPVLVEKVNMGDNHSCVSVAPFMVNDVPVPVGSLVAVHYDEDKVRSNPANGVFPGVRFRLDECLGVRMLRLTTLAVSPANRARAFSVHFEAQVAEGLFEPDSTEIGQLRDTVTRPMEWASTQ